jgi:tRNA (cytidine/uridine-2'-O-)-methyltransferase
MLSLALYHPQIPQNTGTLLRLSSCWNVRLYLIRPLGFLLDDRKLARAGMDYVLSADYEIHDSFEKFLKSCESKRVIALDVSAKVLYRRFQYHQDDVLLVGSEHYGFLKEDLVHLKHRVRIPMLPQRRSLNMAVAAAIVLTEAMSQTNCMLEME